jgi:hypothetical protein
MSRSSSSAPFLTDSSESAPSCEKVKSLLKRWKIGASSVIHLAKLIKNAVKIDQDLALSNLCNVVHSLTGIVADSSILVGEARQHGWHNLGEVPGEFL